jgi:NADH-quinone oxidoreductase subunit A
VLDQYGPIVIFAVIAAAFPVALLWLAKFVRPSFKPTPEKVLPYECGITPESDARGRYTVRFYVIAMFFIVFDIEAIFLYPWAVVFKPLGWFGFWEMLVFIAIIAVGLVYVWGKGALEWE